MVRYMGTTDDFGSQHSGRGRKRPHRHSFSQTQKLEAYFKTCQHPNERQRCQLGREVGLTPTQIKFWFQNKRTLTKAQNGRLEGSALREENEMIKYENLAIMEALNEELCMSCKGSSSGKEEKQQIIERLKIENAQLNAEYERLTNILAKAGVSLSEINSHDALNGTIPRGLSLDNELYSKNLYDPIWDKKPKPLQDFNIPRLFQVVSSGVEELTALMTIESLWIKDPINGRYVIHRDNYEKTFLKISHLNSSHTRFESSKEEGVVRMTGPQLVGMLQESSKRLDLFPTIITKSMAMQRLEAGFSSLNGALQLVHEQIHMLSPLVAPQEFDLIRYSEQVDDGAWIIVDISHNLFNEDKLQPSPFPSWKLPSGCLIKDLSNGFSKITWVEHVEVDDKASVHPLYKDVIFSGLGYGADRYFLSLQRICDRFACQMSETATSQEVEAIRMPGGRRSIMNLTKRMVKDLCAKLSTKSQMDVPQLSQLNNSETRVNVYKNTGPGLPTGVIISVITSLWIPLSYQTAFNFFTNVKNRYQWDVFSNGNQLQEIASITYGNELGNRISIIQQLNPCDTNTVLVQESCMDLQGGIIVYAPIHTKFVDMVLNGEDSSSIPILTSGFILSSDGHTNIAVRDGASSSTATQNGSVLTVALQIMPSENSSFEQINALISSTIQKIKFSLNGSNFE